MAPTLDTVLITLAAVHLTALVGLILSARFSVQLTDEAGRPIKRRSRREPEPRPGELPDPTGYRPGPALRPEPRFLA
jgi:hypothetical protein